MTSRERRPWTPEEDILLRAAVRKEEPGNSAPSKWFAIATHVPGRTNKDCRKRWFARMAVDIVRGVWSAGEDAKLMNAVAKYGTKWSLVATMVHTRNSDQCAKRWTDTLDPTIDRSGWHPEQDQILLDAVKLHGTCWKNIVRTYFPGKTGLSAKNRYTSLTRMQNLSRRPQRVRARSAEDDGQSSSSHTSNESQLPSLHTPPLKQEESWPRHTYSPLHSSSNHPDWEISSSPHAEPHCHHSHSFSTPSYESRPLYSVESSTTYWSTHPTSSTRRQASYSDYDYNTYLSYHSSSSSVVPFSREHGSFYGSSHHSFLPQHPSYRMQDGPYAFHTW